MDTAAVLDPVWSLEAGPTMVLFWRYVDKLELRHIRNDSWPTDVQRLDVSDARLLMRSDRDEDALLVDDDLVVRLALEDGGLRIQIAADDAAAADAELATLRATYPRSTYSDGHVPVTFWSYSVHGPRAVTRKVAANEWEQVAANYTEPVRAELAEMMTSFRPSHGGQLVLWQGEPGTGKTHALRALAWEWRDWAELHYVVDPEVMFGERSDYLLDVLMYETPSYEQEERGGEQDRWRVLLLEDTGEMLAADAKEKVGQGLSRLLNVVDGLIGQGLRVLVLVTTNEELKRLHSAVARPGRCAQKLVFDRLTGPEARQWAIAHGIDPVDAPTDPHSLAELFALVEGYSTRPRECAVGFAAA